MTKRPVQAEGEDGSMWIKRLADWEVDVGETCYRCGRYTSMLAQKPPGYRKLCYQCKKLDESRDSVISNKFLRCPVCRHQWDPYIVEDFMVFEEGEHDVMCGNCTHTFEVGTSVTYNFHSPAMVEETED